MSVVSDSEDLRLILGLKLRNLRFARGASLKQIAEQAGLSISYLSELEQGKKYPKPDKLLRLARALAVTYDELVSVQVSGDLGRLRDAMSSELLREFPFELFGLEREDLVRLVSDAPGKAGALIQTLVDVGRSYDVQVEHFLLSALRSYQQMNANYFEELEEAAIDFRRVRGWPASPPPSLDELGSFLREKWGYRLDEETITDHPDLRAFRSVFVEGREPLLYINGRLLPVQKAFVLAREIGYRQLGLQVRAATSSWLKIESFAQVLNNFKASYFAGALLLDRELLATDLGRLFARSKWDPQAFLDLMRRHRATPEMFLYRLTELVPRLFGLARIFFMRFHRSVASGDVALTKVFNLSSVPVPYGIGLKEHYCRRWPGLRLLEEEKMGPPTQGDPTPPGLPIAAQRSRFIDRDVEFFVIAVVRPLVLDPQVRSSVALGFLLDSKFKRSVRFWNDPEVAVVDVGLTCERCRLSAELCDERVAPPEICRRLEGQLRKEQALAKLMASARLDSPPHRNYPADR